MNSVAAVASLIRGAEAGATGRFQVGRRVLPQALRVFSGANISIRGPLGAKSAVLTALMALGAGTKDLTRFIRGQAIGQPLEIEATVSAKNRKTYDIVLVIFTHGGVGSATCRLEVGRLSGRRS